MSKHERPSLHPADYCTLLGTVVICCGIGVVYGLTRKKAGTKEDFFVGNRAMNFLPLSLSMVVTFQSAILMLGTPAEVYIYGTSVLFIGLGCFTFNILAIFITVPLFRPLRLTSAYEYLQLRFNSRPVRLLCVGLNLATNLIYSGVVIYAPAVALQAVTGLNQWITIASMTVSGVVFTAMGGIQSVIWTDVFLSTIMFSGVIATIVKATSEAGGLSKVWEIAEEGGRLNTFNFNPDPTIRHTFWTLYIPTMLRTVRYAFDQGTVQRVSTASSYKGATLVMALLAPLDMILFGLVMLEGLTIYAYFKLQDVEPLSGGILTNPNQIVPYAVLLLFQDYPGMAGLFLAALFAASLSTLSSMLSTMSIFLMEDILQPRIKDWPDKQQLVLARCAVVGIGLATSLFCIIVSHMKGSLLQICISLLSATTGPLIGIFVLGCFFPSSKAKGVFIGALAGSCLCWGLLLGQNLDDGVTKAPWLPLGNQTFCGEGTDAELISTTPVLQTSGLNASEDCVLSHEDFYRDRPFNIFNLSYNLTAMIGVLVTVSVGLIASYVSGRNYPGDVNPAYFLHIADTWLICFPRPLRRWVKRQGPQFESAWEVCQTGESRSKEKHGDLPTNENESPLLNVEYQASTDGHFVSFQP